MARRPPLPPTQWSHANMCVFCHNTFQHVLVQYEVEDIAGNASNRSRDYCWMTFVAKQQHVGCVMFTKPMLVIGCRPNPTVNLPELTKESSAPLTVLLSASRFFRTRARVVLEQSGCVGTRPGMCWDVSGRVPGCVGMCWDVSGRVPGCVGMCRDVSGRVPEKSGCSLVSVSSLYPG